MVRGAMPTSLVKVYKRSSTSEDGSTTGSAPRPQWKRPWRESSFPQQRRHGSNRRKDHSGGVVFLENIYGTSVAYDVIDAVDVDGDEVKVNPAFSRGVVLQKRLVQIATVSEHVSSNSSEPTLLCFGPASHCGCASFTLRVRPALPEAEGNADDPNAEEWAVSLNGGSFEITQREDWRPGIPDSHMLFVSSMGRGAYSAANAHRQYAQTRTQETKQVNLVSKPMENHCLLTSLFALAGPTPAKEELWECDLLETVRSCLSLERSGFTIEEVFGRLYGLQTKDNSISQAEFNNMILMHIPGLTLQKLELLFRLVNVSGSGEISFEEFKRRLGTVPAAHQPGEAWIQDVIATVRSCVSPLRTGMSIDEVFRRLDGLEKVDNTLSLKEFGKLVLAYQPNLTPMQLGRMFSFVNVSGSGQITFAEFKQCFKSDIDKVTVARSQPAQPIQKSAEANTGQTLSETNWQCGILDTVRSCLSQERCGMAIEEVFKRLDKLETSDNALSPAEFNKMILTYNPDVSPLQLVKLFATVNTSGSGQITFAEFTKRLGPPTASISTLDTLANATESWIPETIAMVRDCLSPARSKMAIEEVFKRLDKLEKADGAISQPEFDKMVLTYKSALTQAQLQQLFAFVNTSRSGLISLNEFKEHFGAQGKDPIQSKASSG